MERREIPKGLVVFQDRNGAIVIRRRWDKSAAASRLSVVAILVIPMVVLPPTYTHGDGFWRILMEYLQHGAALIGGGYFGLCSLFNRTDIIITVDRFRAVSTPLPWWGDRKVSAQEIYSVTVKETKKNAEDGSNFYLAYIDREGKSRELLRAGKGREQVDFIGHAVADIMGVEFLAPDPTATTLTPWMERINKWATSGIKEGKIGALKGEKKEAS